MIICFHTWEGCAQCDNIISPDPQAELFIADSLCATILLLNMMKQTISVNLTENKADYQRRGRADIHARVGEGVYPRCWRQQQRQCDPSKPRDSTSFSRKRDICKMTSKLVLTYASRWGRTQQKRQAFKGANHHQSSMALCSKHSPTLAYPWLWVENKIQEGA